MLAHRRPWVDGVTVVVADGSVRPQQTRLVPCRTLLSSIDSNSHGEGHGIALESRRTTACRGVCVLLTAAPLLHVVINSLGLCFIGSCCSTAVVKGAYYMRHSNAEASAPRGPMFRGRTPSARAADTSSVPGLWKAGPADIYSGPAQKCMYLLKEDPILFDASVDAEFEALSQQKSEEQRQRGGLEKTIKEDTLVLRRRMKEVRESERACIATELLYLKVCSQFQRLKGLTTDIYSKDALELVREHLFSIIGHQDKPSMMNSISVVQIALIQASQVYVMSSFFGYYLRRMDARYQLEKLAGTLGAWGDEPSADLFYNPFAEDDEESVPSLKDYINAFGPKEMMKIGSIASKEAQSAMELQVTALFGDLRTMKQRLQDALGVVGSAEEAHVKLQEVMQNGKVESIRITSEDVRRMVLEAVAFGSLLNDQEQQAEKIYELTPRDDRLFDSIVGDDEGSRMLGE